MAITLSAATPSPATRPETGAAVAHKGFWKDILSRIFDPYRPELHYMRGPGPAWRAKHGASAAFRLPPSRNS